MAKKFGNADSHIFIEKIVLFAVRRRTEDCKTLNKGNELGSTDVSSRFFTAEIGKAVSYFAKLESWSYMDVVCTLIQKLLLDERHSFKKLTSCLLAVGIIYLDWDRKETLFSYCALIVEICCYSLKKGNKDLVQAAVLAAGTALNCRLAFTTEPDPYRYHRYAIEYNKLYEATFPSGDLNLPLNVISKL